MSLSRFAQKSSPSLSAPNFFNKKVLSRPVHATGECKHPQIRIAGLLSEEREYKSWRKLVVNARQSETRNAIRVQYVFLAK